MTKMHVRNNRLQLILIHISKYSAEKVVQSHSYVYEYLSFVHLLLKMAFQNDVKYNNHNKNMSGVLLCEMRINMRAGH